MQAVIEQVQHDHKLLRERIMRLSGPKGLARLEAALAAVRAPPLSPAAPHLLDPETSGTSSCSSSSWSGSPELSPFASPVRGAMAPLPVRTDTPTRLAESVQPRLDASVGGHEQEGCGARVVHVWGTGNDTLLWALLHDMRWQISHDNVNLLWSDATGETSAGLKD